MVDENPAPPEPAPSLRARVGADLGTRVVSGLVVAAIALGLTLAGPAFFAVLLGLAGAVVAWEWSHLVRNADADVAMLAQVVTTLGATLLAAIGQVGLAIVAVAIGTILVALLAVDRRPGLSALGVPYVGLPVIALLWFRADPVLGLEAALFIILAVVATDIGAYFSGRLIGGPKIWVRVSPNKTWAGLGGAIVAAGLVGVAFARVVPATSTMRLAMIGAVLAIVAQIGDFAESALKRHFGRKDASSLIPGHGGLMDRVDGLVTAAVFAGLLAAAIHVWAPARALLQ
jgi:phosphatidate cytidylyltransferase